MTGRNQNDGDKSWDLLNDLFHRSSAYSETEAYLETIRFVSEFKPQGPYNAYLLLRQNPRVSFATSARQWEHKYGASLKPGARPLIILVPFGPVGFVYDIEDVDGELPKGILDPFPAEGTLSDKTWVNTLRNTEAHNIGVRFIPASRQSAGSVTRLPRAERMPSALTPISQHGLFGDAPTVTDRDSVTAKLVVEINDQFDRTQRYVTLIHELAHVICGHFGRTSRTDGRRHSWPDREGLPLEVEELEAESVAYIVGRRAGVEARSEVYLARYVEALKRSGHSKRFSLEVVLGAANRLGSWGRRPPRKTKAADSPSQ